MVDVSSLSPPLRRAREVLPEPLRHPTVLTLLRLSIAEDVDPAGTWTPDAYEPTRNDVTSTATLDADASLEGRLLAKEEGVVAGLPLARALFRLVDERLTLRPAVEEGDRVGPGQKCNHGTRAPPLFK